MWHLLRRGRHTGPLGVSALAVLMMAVALACGSGSEPAPTALPTATQPPSTPVLDLGATSSPANSDNGLASPLAIDLPPPLTLDSLPSISKLVEMVKPAVASISVESLSRGLFFDFADEGTGSGMVVRPDGYIVTNFHVVQNATEIQVSLPDGQTYEGRVVGRDVLTDLAIVKIDAEDLPTVTFGESDVLEVGDWVVALGNALALRGGPTVTLGIVSALGRTIDTERGALYDLLQTDAAINDGNSGGPLVNLAGEVVGINTAILRDAQGIGFAISSSVASPIIDSLIEHGRVVRPLIGLSGADVTPARANRYNLPVTEGVIVTRMSRDGPATAAGIQVGDVIITLDGIPTPDMARFLTLLWTYGVDDEIEVEYFHNGQLLVTSVKLAERPPE